MLRELGRVSAAVGERERAELTYAARAVLYLRNLSENVTSEY